MSWLWRWWQCWELSCRAMPEYSIANLVLRPLYSSLESVFFAYWSRQARIFHRKPGSSTIICKLRAGLLCLVVAPCQNISFLGPCISMIKPFYNMTSGGGPESSFNYFLAQLLSSETWARFVWPLNIQSASPIWFCSCCRSCL